MASQFDRIGNIEEISESLDVYPGDVESLLSEFVFKHVEENLLMRFQGKAHTFSTLDDALGYDESAEVSADVLDLIYDNKTTIEFAARTIKNLIDEDSTNFDYLAFCMWAVFIDDDTDGDNQNYINAARKALDETGWDAKVEIDSDKGSYLGVEIDFGTSE